VIAVDTNIIVRLVAGDDEVQLESVRQLMSARELFVPLTVLLETAWVLRSRYGYGRERIVEALANLVSLEGVAVEEPELVTWALDRHRTGSDFADCVHLVASRDAEAFATFDRELAAKAGANPPLPIETLG
jgi:predicted nucleic-acid-binding protein